MAQDSRLHSLNKDKCRCRGDALKCNGHELHPPMFRQAWLAGFLENLGIHELRLLSSGGI